MASSGSNTDQHAAILRLPSEIISQILQHLPHYAHVCLVRSCKPLYAFGTSQDVDAGNQWKLKRLHEHQIAVSKEETSNGQSLACSGCFTSHDREQFTDTEIGKDPQVRLCRMRSQGVVAGKGSYTNLDTARWMLLFGTYIQNGRYAKTTAPRARLQVKLLSGPGSTEAPQLISELYPSGHFTYQRTLTLSLQRLFPISLAATTRVVDHYAIQNFRFAFCPHRADYTGAMLRKYCARVNLSGEGRIPCPNLDETLMCETCLARVQVTVKQSDYQVNGEARVVGTYWLGDLQDLWSNWGAYVGHDMEVGKTMEMMRLRKAEVRKLEAHGLQELAVGLDARLATEEVFRDGMAAAIVRMEVLRNKKSGVR